MNRRSFVKATLAAAALSALPKPDAVAAQTFTKPRLKIGLLGGSHSHGFAKAKVLLESAEYELVGVCYEDPKVREQFEKAGLRSLTQEQLLAACEIVAVESDNKEHARHAKAALFAGKHLHLEKPPTDTLPDFRELLNLARDRKRLMQMGYMWRYHPGINAALEAARKGWLGEVYLVRGTIDTQVGAESRQLWAQFRGGVFFELGCHLVDPLIRLLGKPQQITSSLRRLGNDKLADNTVVTFEFPRALGIITSAAIQPRAQAHRSFEILGANGQALVKPIEPPSLQIDLAKAAGPYVAGSQTVALRPYRRYAPELADLAAAIREGRPLSVTLEEDLMVHEALLRACEM